MVAMVFLIRDMWLRVHTTMQTVGSSIDGDLNKSEEEAAPNPPENAAHEPGLNHWSRVVRSLPLEKPLSIFSTAFSTRPRSKSRS